MKAMVLTGPGRFDLVEIPLPEVPPDGILVRLEGSGVCGSNLPVWEGRPWFQYPLEPGAPGHEGWGVVEAVGRNARRFKKGDRVTLLSQHAFAEYDVAPESHAVLLPPALEKAEFPGEALGCAINVLHRAPVAAGEIVAIVGIGFLGALLCSLCVGRGAQVIAISRRPTGLEIARRLGARWCLPLSDSRSTREVIDEITDGHGCPWVFEAAGVQTALDVASALPQVRGRLVIAGYHQDGLRQVNLQSWNWLGLDVINAHERDPAVYLRGMREAVDTVACGDLDLSLLFTHRFSLHEFDRALESLASRPEGFLKAILRYA